MCTYYVCVYIHIYIHIYVLYTYIYIYIYIHYAIRMWTYLSAVMHRSHKRRGWFVRTLNLRNAACQQTQYSILRTCEPLILWPQLLMLFGWRSSARSWRQHMRSSSLPPHAANAPDACHWRPLLTPQILLWLQKPVPLHDDSSGDDDECDHDQTCYCHRHRYDLRL